MFHGHSCTEMQPAIADNNSNGKITRTNFVEITLIITQLSTVHAFIHGVIIL